MRTYEFIIRNKKTGETATRKTWADTKANAIKSMTGSEYTTVAIKHNGTYGWEVVRSSFRWVD